MKPIDQGEMFPVERPNSTNFLDNMQMPVHRWFRYSAGFSADWVARLLKESATGSEMRVLDPFAGSATTLLAAQYAGVESMGIDSHPFVSRVAEAKLRWTADSCRLLEEAQSIAASVTPERPASVPRLLESCYTEDALAQLLGLRAAVEKRQDGSDISQLVWLALVCIIRRASHVGTAQWQYVLPNKTKRAVAPVDAFLAQIDMMAADMAWRQMECHAPPPALYHRADTRLPGIIPRGWATHVICSPPYANNYDYADATRLEQTVLGEVAGWADLKGIRTELVRSCSQHMVGYDPADAVGDPILAPIADELAVVYEKLEMERHTHGGKKAYHSMIVAYFHDLARVWHCLRDGTAEGASVCFVIGDSAPYGVYVPVERWLGDLAVSAGFESWTFDKVRDRNIKWKNRKHRVPLKEGHLWVCG